MNYTVKCSCKSIEVNMTGEPKVRGNCHCSDCRELLNIPFHSVNAWEKENVSIVNGEELLFEFQHPSLSMKKVMCKKCGEVIFNTNAMDWRVFSQHFISKSYEGKLPSTLNSKSHFFYSSRIVSIEDDLPKKG